MHWSFKTQCLGSVLALAVFVCTFTCLLIIVHFATNHHHYRTTLALASECHFTLPVNMTQCSVLHSESTFGLNPPWKRVQGGPYGAEGGLDCTQARCISNDHHLVSCTFMMNRWIGVLPINREGGSIFSFDWLEGCFSVAMIVFGMVVKDLPGFSILVPCACSCTHHEYWCPRGMLLCVYQHALVRTFV